MNYDLSGNPSIRILIRITDNIQKRSIWKLLWLSQSNHSLALQFHKCMYPFQKSAASLIFIINRNEFEVQDSKKYCVTQQFNINVLNTHLNVLLLAEYRFQRSRITSSILRDITITQELKLNELHCSGKILKFCFFSKIMFMKHGSYASLKKFSYCIRSFLSFLYRACRIQ